MVKTYNNSLKTYNNSLSHWKNSIVLINIYKNWVDIATNPFML